jgi:xylulokinase
VLTAEEGGAYGAALLAGVGVGAWPDTDTACERSLQVAESFQPDSEAGNVYAEAYRRYRAVYPALRAIRSA